MTTRVSLSVMGFIAVILSLAAPQAALAQGCADVFEDLAGSTQVAAEFPASTSEIPNERIRVPRDIQNQITSIMARINQWSSNDLSGIDITAIIQTAHLAYLPQFLAKDPIGFERAVRVYSLLKHLSDVISADANQPKVDALEILKEASEYIFNKDYVSLPPEVSQSEKKWSALESKLLATYGTEPPSLRLLWQNAASPQEKDFVRLQNAEILMGRQLTDVEKTTILQAHYNEKTLLGKVRLLRTLNLSRKERESLIRNFIAGDSSKKVEPEKGKEDPMSPVESFRYHRERWEIETPEDPLNFPTRPIHLKAADELMQYVFAVYYAEPKNARQRIAELSKAQATPLPPDANTNGLLYRMMRISMEFSGDLRTMIQVQGIPYQKFMKMLARVMFIESNLALLASEEVDVNANLQGFLFQVDRAIDAEGGPVKYIARRMRPDQILPIGDLIAVRTLQ